jgi:aryl-alcohol dehydrogenase-like predicted oxidoreductase
LETDDQKYLSLAEVLAAARDVAGEQHRFRAVQLPFNLEMDEAASLQNQGDSTLLQAASAAGLMVFGSASILQGRLSQQIPQPMPEGLRALRTDAQRALQFARSTPGIACALVGMKTQAHVDENAALAKLAPLVG